MSALPAGQGNEAVEIVLASTKEVAVLPQVVYKIMEMTSSTDSSAAMLERAIIIDPGFSTKILTQANSAYYALPRKVTSIKEAVAFLGFRAVRQLAMAVGVFDLFLGKTDAESIRRRGWWRHSLDTALCCRCVSERQGLKLSDEGYTAGLLHYLGKTLLDRADSSKYEKVALLMANDVSDVQAEKAVYGCDHVEVGRAATERWGFPEVLLAGMEYQDEPAPDDRFKLVKALVRASDRIAKLAVEGNSGQEMDLERFGCWSPHYLGIHDDETLTRVIGDATEAIASAASFAF